MRRREFIAITAAGLGAATPAFSISTSSRMSPQDLTDVTQSIHGAFGSGFKVVSAERTPAGITARIEHLENFLTVEAEADLADWTIIRSTDM